jgi:hypothetical protein
MDIDPEVVGLSVRLTETAARNTATAIGDRIRSSKAAAQAQETIGQLEQIVSELLDDKQELTRIARSYQQELVAQQLTHGDVSYIADTLVPLLEKLAVGMGEEEGAKFRGQVDAFKPLLSVETVNILQILGFNFRRAIGEPLTKLVESQIAGRVGTSVDPQVETIKLQRAAMELAQDPEAFARFQQMNS